MLLDDVSTIEVDAVSPAVTDATVAEKLLNICLMAKFERLVSIKG